jgi:hypothetical protein
MLEEGLSRAGARLGLCWGKAATGLGQGGDMAGTELGKGLALLGHGLAEHWDKAASLFE